MHRFLFLLINIPFAAGVFADEWAQWRGPTQDGVWREEGLVERLERVWMFNERGELLITRLSPKGLEIVSRAQLIEPTRDQLNQRGGVCWAHPAFAYKHVFARNDEALVCASLASQP